MAIIDAATHVHSKPYFEKLLSLPNAATTKKTVSIFLPQSEKNPQFHDVDIRIADMDKYGITSQITSIHHALDPNDLRELDKETEIELCKFLNDCMADFMDRSRGRIFSVGTLPFSALKNEGVEEMRRAINDLGLKGFLVLSNIHGKPIDQYEEFWAEAERLDVPVYIHPTDPLSNLCREYENEFDLTHVLGWPFETSLILSRLVFSGMMQKHPRLKIIAHHLGGMIPFFGERINESYNRRKTTGVSVAKPDQAVSRIDDRPTVDLFRDFYYDTAVGGSAPAIRCALDVFGAERIVFGTDYPFGPDGGRHRLATYPGKVKSMGLSKSDNDRIYEETIRRIAKI